MPALWPPPHIGHSPGSVLRLFRRTQPQYEAVNVEGTRRLLRALQSLEVEQFIYASTMLVHAQTAPGQPINQDAPLKPA
ncbi:NAD-dependent epimerase/dehydratase family protein [Cupriavidus necator]